ncbi:YdiU family protein [Pseudarthrobacter phenanthrenivorans]|uniref:protein adenylyltransferase SelO n=1 Tax=Pseudarthrobacter phenanthrenivorans TaxID=361575 RepID=UPI00112EEDCF|nr:YdiU family protein [Pseudarthrobacter phenanthrenivorans]TPV53176.1 YdiU family protein [Pseudarthrobacter phenanthrenivorans]
MTAAAESMITFEGRFARELAELAVPWQAEEAPHPELLVLNEALVDELGMAPEYLRSPEGVRLLLGNHVPAGATPVAQAYAGHQFGGYSPLLGDGRALLLGEIVDDGGRLRDVHLKGSGRTPFARAGDGRAVIGPMLREYLISEAMHALGIPTTRALAVVATGRAVRRETMLPGAVLARVASSHLRVGSFQYARATENVELLRRLADHAISRHHPAAAEAENPYLALFEAVVAAQARLVAKWMLVGFVHGVMNTDNMTISGETIDYGPCAFMDAFNPGAVYSSIDVGGRYAYANQPVIAEWNLARLAEAMLPLFNEDQEQAVAPAVEALGRFRSQYSDAWFNGMKEKLGLPASMAGTPEGDAASDVVDGVVALLKDGPVDYTQFFRNLGYAARGNSRPARGMVLDLAAFDAWAERWTALNPDSGLMDRVNPVYIPRNHLVEEALAAATEGDLGPFNRFLDVVRSPFQERQGLERYTEGPPEDFGDYRTFCGT